MLNIVFIGIDIYDPPAYWVLMLDTANWIFVVFFALEACTKIFALGPQYFLSPWNRLDFGWLALGIVRRISQFDEHAAFHGRLNQVQLFAADVHRPIIDVNDCHNN